MATATPSRNGAYWTAASLFASLFSGFRARWVVPLEDDESTSLTSGSTSESSGAKCLDSGVDDGRDLVRSCPRPRLTNEGRKSGSGLAGTS